jgi:hypothetical protein
VAGGFHFFQNFYLMTVIINESFRNESEGRINIDNSATHSLENQTPIHTQMKTTEKYILSLFTSQFVVEAAQTHSEGCERSFQNKKEKPIMETLKRANRMHEVHGESVLSDAAKLKPYHVLCESRNKLTLKISRKGQKENLRSSGLINWKFFTDAIVTRPLKLRT